MIGEIHLLLYVDKKNLSFKATDLKEKRLGDQTIFDTPLSDCPSRNGR